MKHEQLLEVLMNIACGIAKLMGRDTEVVVHDLYKMEMVYIANGYVSDRSVGVKMDQSVYQIIINQADEDGHMIGYSSTVDKGKKLRSSHFLIRDEAGEPEALICINQNLSKLEELRDYINYLIYVKDDSLEEPEGGNIIQSVTQKAIMNSMWKMTAADLDSKEGKIALLKDLKRQGVFDVKATTPYICKSLSISQTTLYNYLREIRAEEEAGEKTEIRIR